MGSLRGLSRGPKYKVLGSLGFLPFKGFYLELRGHDLLFL